MQKKITQTGASADRFMAQIEAQRKNEEQKEKRVTALTVKKKGERISIEQNSLEMALVLNTTPEEQKKKIARRELGEGRYIQVSALVDREMVRREDIATLLICFLLWKHRGAKKEGYVFEASYRQFFKMLGLDPGGRQETEIKESLKRLRGSILVTNFWWEKISGQRITMADFNFLDSVEEGTEKTLRISLSRHIAQSMESGYLKWLEEGQLLGILKLRRPYAKVLALFFLKRLYGNNEVAKYSLNSVLELLGLKESYERREKKYRNKDVKRTISPAVKEAARTLGYEVKYEKAEEMFYIYQEVQTLALPGIA